MNNNIKQELRTLTKRLKSIKAKDIMTKKIITATERANLADIAKLMIKDRISGLPVLRKKNKLVGVITATDLFVVMDMIKSGDVVSADMRAISNPAVKFAMSTQVVKIKKNTTLEKIITIMKYKNVSTLPVVEGKRLVGVIGRRDVLKNFYSAVKSLRH
jgi:CBS domain-containing protein